MKNLILTLCVAAALAACAKPAAAPKAAEKLTGTVLETQNAGGVTYVHLKTPSGERWIVTSPADLEVGANVTVRTFDNVVFGTIDGARTASAHTHVLPARSQELGNVKVEKADGGKTIAEVWASKGALKDQKVVVRGKVVKFLPSIMGKNWLHVRDGSGTPAKGDNDLAVISDDAVKVGSVVTVTGTVRLDKDFGAGYQYPVIIEDARLK